MKEMTKNALKDALAGESQAHVKYLAFADIAEREGHDNIANLFRAIAEAEKIHAVNHARELGLLGNTMENLRNCSRLPPGKSNLPKPPSEKTVSPVNRTISSPL